MTEPKVEWAWKSEETYWKCPDGRHRWSSRAEAMEYALAAGIGDWWRLVRITRKSKKKGRVVYRETQRVDEVDLENHQPLVALDLKCGHRYRSRVYVSAGSLGPVLNNCDVELVFRERA